MLHGCEGVHLKVYRESEETPDTPKMKRTKQPDVVVEPMFLFAKD